MLMEKKKIVGIIIFGEVRMGTWCGARTALWSWTTGSDCLHKRSRQEWGPGACELHGEGLGERMLMFSLAR